MPSQESPGTMVRLFAEDCLVYRKLNPTKIKSSSQGTYTYDLQLWAERWAMRFSPRKCYIMHVACRAHWVKMHELCGVTLDCATAGDVSQRYHQC